LPVFGLASKRASRCPGIQPRRVVVKGVVGRARAFDRTLSSGFQGRD
jgi:hypothetical protein